MCLLHVPCYNLFHTTFQNNIISSTSAEDIGALTVVMMRLYSCILQIMFNFCACYLVVMIKSGVITTVSCIYTTVIKFNNNNN